MTEPPPVAWPEGRRFAFTVVDDTDFATLESVRPVYDLLAELGFRTTKTVWPLPATAAAIAGGDSLDDEPYCRWVQSLHERGFEIAMHGAADQGSTRAEVEQGLARFHDVVGRYPRIHVNHFGQDESLYWGADRFDPPFRGVYRAIHALRRTPERYHGHEQGSPWFWGDLAREHVSYVRNLTFSTIDTLAVDPVMPYHDSRRPWVNHWFSSSDAGTRDRFVELLGERNQDRLAAAGGACLAYTHFGAHGFVNDGCVDPEVERLLRRLAGLGGWYVPASTLLDHVGEARGWPTVDRRGPLLRMQLRWFAEKLKTREVS